MHIVFLQKLILFERLTNPILIIGIPCILLQRYKTAGAAQDK